MHLGIGAFHRAHQAVYTHKAMAESGGDWMIRGVSLRSDATRAALAGQDFLYSNWTRGADADHADVIASICDVLSTSHHGADAIVAAIADPAIRIVTLTITEKGYCATSGRTLDFEHADIRTDLSTGAPASVIGFLVRGLAQRKETGGEPLTVLSCDNLSANGQLTRTVVRELAEATEPALVPWIEDRVTFPSTMVDRIVPATTAADADHFEARFGYRDDAMVLGEPWSQWVIEDAFAGERPHWEVAGAQFVPDVTPYETAKLRLLNASHSACAYLGVLAGHEFVHEAIADPEIRAFVVSLMDQEVTPTLPELPGLDGYKAAILERFANAAVPYRTAQVAMDGSQKLPQRLLPVVAERLNAGHSVALAAEVIGAWCVVIEQNRELVDPMADVLRATMAEAGVDGVLKLSAIFGELGHHAAFAQAVTRSHAQRSRFP